MNLEILNHSGAFVALEILVALAILLLPLGRVKGFIQFVRSVFSESDGSASFGRLGFGAIIASVIFYIVYQTLHARAIEWGNIGVFLGSAGAVTYAANKFATALAKS